MNASGRSAFSTLTVLVVIGTLLLGILACNLGGSSDIAETEEVSEPGGGPETQPLLKPTSAPEGTSPTEAPASVELEIVNESSEAICFVYIAPSASESWGVDQLGGETIIAPGDSFSIDEIPPGSYDLLAQDCDEQTLVESSAEVFEDDLYTWTIFDQTPGGDTMLVTDDYNSIQMEVPTSWNDLNGEPWYDGGDVIGASLWASPDLDGFNTTWDIPGVIFSVSDDLSKLGGYVQLLDILREDVLQYCELEGRYDYEDPLYRGKYDLFEKCGGPGGADYMVLSAVSKDDQYSYLILVEMQFVTDEDWAVSGIVLDSFEVIGTLP